MADTAVTMVTGADLDTLMSVPSYVCCCSLIVRAIMGVCGRFIVCCTYNFALGSIPVVCVKHWSALLKLYSVVHVHKYSASILV